MVQSLPVEGVPRGDRIPLRGTGGGARDTGHAHRGRPGRTRTGLTRGVVAGVSHRERRHAGCDREEVETNRRPQPNDVVDPESPLNLQN